MATTLIRRLGLASTDVEVVWGGGSMRNGISEFAQTTAGVIAVAPQARVSVLDVAPIYGALVEAFDQAGADRTALAPLRAAMAY